MSQAIAYHSEFMVFLILPGSDTLPSEKGALLSVFSPVVQERVITQALANSGCYLIFTKMSIKQCVWIFKFFASLTTLPLTAWESLSYNYYPSCFFLELYSHNCFLFSIMFTFFFLADSLESSGFQINPFLLVFVLQICSPNLPPIC